LRHFEGGLSSAGLISLHARSGMERKIQIHPRTGAGKRYIDLNSHHNI
jgi:hypothetical protein